MQGIQLHVLVTSSVDTLVNKQISVSHDVVSIIVTGNLADTLASLAEAHAGVMGPPVAESDHKAHAH